MEYGVVDSKGGGGREVREGGRLIPTAGMGEDLEQCWGETVSQPGGRDQQGAEREGEERSE